MMDSLQHLYDRYKRGNKRGGRKEDRREEAKEKRKRKKIFFFWWKGIKINYFFFQKLKQKNKTKKQNKKTKKQKNKKTKQNKKNKKKKTAKLEILCFPCNSFGQQEPTITDSSTIKKRYKDYTLPLMSPVIVNGKRAHPLFSFISNKLPGMSDVAAIRWNFEIFVTNRKGEPIVRFPPTTALSRIEEFVADLFEG